MSVSSVSSNSSLTQTDWRSVTKQWTQDFKQLSSSLQDGDLAGAQKAFKALQQLQQSNQLGGPSSNGQPASSGNNRHAGGWPEQRIRRRAIRASWPSSSRARFQRVGFRQQYGRPNGVHQQR